MTMSYKMDADGSYALDANGDRIPRITPEKQLSIFREKLLEYHIQGFKAIDSSPSNKACLLYKIGRHKDGKINGITIRRASVTVYGNESITDMKLYGKQTIKQLHKITEKLLEVIEDEEENHLR